MNASETQQIKSLLKELDEQNIPQLIANRWPGADYSALTVGNGVTANQMISLMRRIISHFGGAIEEEPELLPRFVFSVDNYRSGQDILDNLQSLRNGIVGADWNQAATFAIRVAQYLQMCGQWSKGVRRTSAVYQKKASELLAESETKLIELRRMLDSLKTERDSLAETIKQGQQDHEAMQEQLEESKQDRQKLAELLQQASKEEGQLGEIVGSQKSNLTATNTSLAEANKAKEDLEKALKQAEDFYNKAKQDSQWVLEKREEIDRLTGRAADGSLGGTFQKRKQELEKSATTWQNITVLATIATAIYVPVAFTLIPSPVGNDWLILLANLGKIAPVVLFMGFVLRQYSRERSFLEEYAFKTAVAFVVNAYADQLAHERFQKTASDFGDDVDSWQSYVENREDERKQLIKETVGRLFSPPQIHAEKEPSLVVFRPKQAADILREAKELIKEAKQ